MGSLTVPQGRLLTQHFVRNKMGCMENLLREPKSKATCECIGSSEEHETEFCCFHWSVLCWSHHAFPWMISILIKQLFLVLVRIHEIQNSGAGSSVKTCFCRWWFCSKYISRVGAIGLRGSLGLVSDHILSFSWHDEWTALSCGLHGFLLLLFSLQL